MAPAVCPWLYDARPPIFEDILPGTDEYKQALADHMMRPSSYCCDHGYVNEDCFPDEYLASHQELQGDLSIGHLECCYPNLPRLLRDPAPAWMEEELREHLAPEAVAQPEGFDSAEARDAFERECASGPMSMFMRFRAEGVVGVRATSEVWTREAGMGLFDAVRRALEILRYHAPAGSLEDLDVFVSGSDCAIRAWPVSFLTLVRRRSLSGHGIAILPSEWSMTWQARRLALKILSVDKPWEAKQPVVFWRGNLLSALWQLYAVPDDLGFPHAVFPDVGPPTWHEPCEFFGGVHPDNRTRYTQAFGARMTLRNWYLHPRGRLALLSKLAPDVVDAKFSKLSAHWVAGDVEEVSALVKALGMTTETRADYEDHANYRYLVQVDYSDRLPWLLQMEAVVLVSDTVLEQLLVPSTVLRPFEHYLPIKPDLSDLLERVAWAESHPEEAAAIARRGSRLARRLFTHENVLHYLYRVIRAQAEARKRRRKAADARS